MILQIFNKIAGHYEIIESIINKYHIIIETKNINIIYLKVHESDKSFKEYIQKKYPDIKFGMSSTFDYHIDCSIYPKHYEMIKDLDKKKYYFVFVLKETRGCQPIPSTSPMRWEGPPVSV